MKTVIEGEKDSRSARMVTFSAATQNGMPRFLNPGMAAETFQDYESVTVALGDVYPLLSIDPRVLAAPQRHEGDEGCNEGGSERVGHEGGAEEASDTGIDRCGLLPWVPADKSVVVIQHDLLHPDKEAVTKHSDRLALVTQSGHVPLPPAAFQSIVLNRLRHPLSTTTRSSVTDRRSESAETVATTAASDSAADPDTIDLTDSTKASEEKVEQSVPKNRFEVLLPHEWTGIEAAESNAKRCRRAVTNAALYMPSSEESAVKTKVSNRMAEKPDHRPRLLVPIYACSVDKSREVSVLQIPSIIEASSGGDLVPSGLYISGVESASTPEAQIESLRLLQEPLAQLPELFHQTDYSRSSSSTSTASSSDSQASSKRGTLTLACGRISLRCILHCIKTSKEAAFAKLPELRLCFATPSLLASNKRQILMDFCPPGVIKSVGDFLAWIDESLTDQGIYSPLPCECQPIAQAPEEGESTENDKAEGIAKDVEEGSSSKKESEAQTEWLAKALDYRVRLYVKHNLKDGALLEKLASVCFTNIPDIERALFGRTEAEIFGERYSQAYMCHLLSCNEAVGFQLLEWHNWRILGLLKRIVDLINEHKPGKLNAYLRYLELTNTRSR